MSELISLLVTTYNVENFIEKAITSALALTYKPLEIIVVDDCSTDKTWQKLQVYKSQLKLIRHVRRQRVSAALNTALKKAQGKYIARLDGDDQLYPDIFKIEMKELYAHPECGFVYCDYEEINQSGKLIRQVKLPEFSPQLIHHKDYIAMGNLVRRECYDKVGIYDTSMKKQEHYDWSIRLISQYLGYHVPKKLFTYTRHSMQATSITADLRFYTEKIRQKYSLNPEGVVQW